MTDRINGLFVVLEEDTRIDDLAPTINAIQQLKGVLSVSPNVADYQSEISDERARNHFRKALWDVLIVKRQ